MKKGPKFKREENAIVFWILAAAPKAQRTRSVANIQFMHLHFSL